MQRTWSWGEHSQLIDWLLPCWWLLELWRLGDVELRFAFGSCIIAELSGNLVDN